MSWSDTGWVWIVAALFTGGLVKGLSGVGLPMISVPLLALILPVNEAVTLLSLPILFANLLQSTSISREIIGQRWLYCLVIALLAGMVCGSLILSNQSKGITILTGLMIIVFSTLSLAGFHFTLNQKLRLPIGILTGVFAGFTGGSNAMYGWPLVMFLSSLSLTPAQFVGTVSLLYLLAHSGFMALLLLRGMLDLDSTGFSLLACIPVFAGIELGRRMMKRLPLDRGFYRLVSVLMLAGGISLLLKA